MTQVGLFETGIHAAPAIEIAVNRQVVGKLAQNSSKAAWEQFNTGFETLTLTPLVDGGDGVSSPHFVQQFLRRQG